VFEPRFASEAHAEMVLVSRLEAERPDLAPAGLTLVVSLEPCPMCYARLKLAGHRPGALSGRRRGRRHDAARRHMPLAWTTLHPAQEFAPARVSPRLRRLALAIFRCNLHGDALPAGGARPGALKRRAAPGLSTCAGRRSPRGWSR
jgi:hypothetical protein